MVDPSLIVVVGTATVAVLGAFFAGIVKVINAITVMKTRVISMEKAVAEVHTAVNGTSVALKEQNEQLTIDAIHVASEKADQAYQKGHAEGQLQVLREVGRLPEAKKN